MSNDLSLLEEVEYVLILKAPLVEFDSTSKEQIIMSPAFQHRILDALLDLLPNHRDFTLGILQNTSLLIPFTTKFVNFYRQKQLNSASND